TLLLRRRLGVHMPLRNLVADERAVHVMAAAAPALTLAVQDGELSLLVSPAQVAQQSPDLIDRETLDKLQVSLDELN
ncbi:hypothetical protein EFN17_06710, partial [Propionibacterium freudenreichii]|nr:hypothetical protein [Propionibacterium freudenreichii]